MNYHYIRLFILSLLKLVFHQQPLTNHPIYSFIDPTLIQNHLRNILGQIKLINQNIAIIEPDFHSFTAKFGQRLFLIIGNLLLFHRTDIQDQTRQHVVKIINHFVHGGPWVHFQPHTNIFDLISFLVSWVQDEIVHSSEFLHIKIARKFYQSFIFIND